MNLQEIKQAIENGETVFCGNIAYTVVKDKLNQYLIKCSINGSCIGLTWKDGVTLNDIEKNFFTV